ncbi:peptidyl-prolyl cis-trans isomerase [Mesonia sediminis]|uniref:Peptidyl-prolyl cis-trans isomerase n=1 Tax=Mesonia sediminis TaxID=1703946 RepID=A0ABW5SFW0_9FLAO
MSRFLKNYKKNLNKIRLSLLSLLALLLVQCDLLVPAESKTPLAKVYDNYLYEEQVLDLMPKQLTGEDSVIFLRNYVKDWATEQLLLHRAKINLSQEKQQEFNRLVEQYKINLYSEAYKSMLIGQRIDTTVSQTAIRDYYQENKENFKLNQNLVRLRYIQIPLDFKNTKELKKNFDRFNLDDQIDIQDQAITYLKFRFNDSTWYNLADVIKDVPLLDEQKIKENQAKLLQLEDSSSVFLVKIKDFKARNELAPVEYVEPTIKQILINRRKLKLADELEKEIIDNAIKNRKFEEFY